MSKQHSLVELLGSLDDEVSIRFMAKVTMIATREAAKAPAGDHSSLSALAALALMVKAIESAPI